MIEMEFKSILVKSSEESGELSWISRPPRTRIRNSYSRSSFGYPTYLLWIPWESVARLKERIHFSADQMKIQPQAGRPACTGLRAPYIIPREKPHNTCSSSSTNSTARIFSFFSKAQDIQMAFFGGFACCRDGIFALGDLRGNFSESRAPRYCARGGTLPRFSGDGLSL